MTEPHADGVNMFTCADCGGRFEKARSDGEARAEADQLWGGMKPDEEAVVCEDCWQTMMASQQGQQLQEEAARFGVSLIEWRRLLEVGLEDPLVRGAVELVRGGQISAADALAGALVLQSRAWRDLMKRHVDLVTNGPQPPMTLVLPNGAEVKAGSVLPGGVRRTRAAAELDATIFGTGAYEEAAPARWCSDCGVAEAEAGPVKDDAHLRGPDDACGPLMTVAQMVQQIGDLSDELGEQVASLHETQERLKMVRALATDQFNMHRNNGDGLEVTGRISSMLMECGDALRGVSADPAADRILDGMLAKAEKVAAADRWDAEAGSYRNAIQDVIKALKGGG